MSGEIVITAQNSSTSLNVKDIVIQMNSVTLSNTFFLKKCDFGNAVKKKRH